MARLRGHQPLDVGRVLYVMRGNTDAPVTIGGRSFVAGEVLPWRDLGLSKRKLDQLWDQRRIGHEKRDERNGAEDPVVRSAKKPKRPRQAG